MTKCAALLQQRVSVAIVDLVTIRQFNLYGDLLELIGQTDPALAPEPPSLYAAACRWTHPDEAWRFQAWNHALALGQPLPTLPLWLADELRRAPRAGGRLRGDVPHPPPGVSRGRLVTRRWGRRLRPTAVLLNLVVIAGGPLLDEGSTAQRPESPTVAGRLGPLRYAQVAAGERAVSLGRSQLSPARPARLRESGPRDRLGMGTGDATWISGQSGRRPLPAV